MFAISTSDYAVTRGDRPSSPLATVEERKIFRKNEMTIKKAIENVLPLHLVTMIFSVLMLFW